jgi:hypothetical protein
MQSAQLDRADGTINEVVAVLLIHIEMKAVRIMKPARSRRGE